MWLLLMTICTTQTTCGGPLYMGNFQTENVCISQRESAISQASKQEQRVIYTCTQIK